MSIGELCPREVHVVRLQAVHETRKRKVGCVVVVSIDDHFGVVAEQLSSLARLVERRTRFH